jgi:prepilin-type N-terminal cleavage/methylation domain-containing protein
MTLSYKQSLPGFTLIETLVSVAIFSLAISLGTLTIVSMSRASGRVSSKDQAVQSAYYIMDSLTRSIRTGSDYVRQPVSGAFQSFSWKDQYAVQNQLRLSSTAVPGLEIKKGSRDWMPLHDSYVLQIKTIDFIADGESKTDKIQPSVRVNIVFQYQYRDQVSLLPIQTILTQRSLDTDRFIPTINTSVGGQMMPAPPTPQNVTANPIQ